MKFTYSEESPFKYDGFSPFDGCTSETEYTGMKIVVMGEYSARKYIPGDDEVCISITTRNKVGFNVGDVPLDHRFEDILRLKFDDTAVDSMGSDSPESITSQQADSVVQFVLKHRNRKKIVIHCFAGVSRSRSMAAAIVDSLDLPYSFTVLNLHVYDAVIDAFKRG